MQEALEDSCREKDADQREVPLAVVVVVDAKQALQTIWQVVHSALTEQATSMLQ